MESELNNLEAKLTALIGEYEKVCARNQTLSAQITTLQAENKRLADKLAVAAERVEGILACMPEEQS